MVLLFTVSKELYSPNEDLKCGIVYVPPFGSKFASNDPFFELQNEIFRHFGDSKHVFLLGDFNARCGDLSDYTAIDDSLSFMFDLQHMQDEDDEVFIQFDMNNTPLNRNSVDKRVIVNPKLTCKNSSTVDYALSSSYIFATILEFKVEDYSFLYSDAHCPLSLKLRRQRIPQIEPIIHRTNNSPQTKTVKREERSIVC